VIFESLAAASASSSVSLGYASASGAQYIALPLPADLRPVSSHAMAPLWSGGSPARRFSIDIRVRLPTSFGRELSHSTSRRAWSFTSSLLAVARLSASRSASWVSSVGSPARQPKLPPPTISRWPFGCASRTSSSERNSSVAPSESPIASPGSTPMKRCLRSMSSCVMAFGYFLRMFGSGLMLPIVPPQSR
jgi:hypothetical protein